MKYSPRCILAPLWYEAPSGGVLLRFCETLLLCFISDGFRVLAEHFPILGEVLIKLQFWNIFTFKDNEELRLSCPVPTEDENTDCTSVQQLSLSSSPPCTADFSALRYKFPFDIPFIFFNYFFCFFWVLSFRAWDLFLTLYSGQCHIQSMSLCDSMISFIVIICFAVSVNCT